MNVFFKALLTCCVLQCLSHSTQAMTQPASATTQQTSPRSPISGEITSLSNGDRIFHLIKNTDFAAYVDTKVIHLKIGTKAGKFKQPTKELRITHTKYSHGVAITIAFERSQRNEKTFQLVCNLSGELIDQLCIGENIYKNKKPSELCNDLPDDPEFYWLIALLRFLPMIARDAFTWTQLKKHWGNPCFPTKDRADDKTRKSQIPFKYELWDGLFCGAILYDNPNATNMFLTLADPELITDDFIMGELAIESPAQPRLILPLYKHQADEAVSARPNQEGKTLLQQNGVNGAHLAEFIGAALDILYEERYCFDESGSDESDDEEDEDESNE